MRCGVCGVKRHCAAGLAKKWALRGKRDCVCVIKLLNFYTECKRRKATETTEEMGARSVTLDLASVTLLALFVVNLPLFR